METITEHELCEIDGGGFWAGLVCGASAVFAGASVVAAVADAGITGWEAAAAVTIAAGVCGVALS
jgi:hypothetical protein